MNSERRFGWGSSALQHSAVVEFANSLAGVDDTTTIYSFTAPPPLNQPILLAAVFYNGPEGKATEIFAPLIAINLLMNTTGPIPYETLNAIVNDAVALGVCKTSKGSSLTLPVFPTFVQSVLDDLSAFLAHVPEAGGTLVIFECVGPSKILTVPQSATAFASRGSYINSAATLRWLSRA
jgi:hypothetical protein